MDLVQQLIKYHADRIQPGCALHYSDVQDLADMYSVSAQEILVAMDIADLYLNQSKEENSK